MTPEEAKAKWCPMVRCIGYYTTEVSPGTNTDLAAVDNCHMQNRNPEYARCTGAACMMWRFDGGDGWCGLAGRRQVEYHKSPKVNP